MGNKTKSTWFSMQLENLLALPFGSRITQCMQYGESTQLLYKTNLKDKLFAKSRCLKLVNDCRTIRSAFSIKLDVVFVKKVCPPPPAPD